MFVLVFVFLCWSLLQISRETQNNINAKFFFSSLWVETDFWGVDCRILAHPDGFLIKHPQIPGFVGHFAAIIPIYSEKNPPISGLGQVDRGTEESGENDVGSIMVGDRNGGCQCLRGRAEKRTKDYTICYKQFHLIFSVLSPPLFLMSPIQRHCHIIPLENEPPLSWNEGQGEGCQMERVLCSCMEEEGKRIWEPNHSRYKFSTKLLPHPSIPQHLGSQLMDPMRVLSSRVFITFYTFC